MLTFGWREFPQQRAVTGSNWRRLAATGGEIAALAPESLTRPIALDCTEPSALNSPASGPMGLGPSFCPFQRGSFFFLQVQTFPSSLHLPLQAPSPNPQ